MPGKTRGALSFAEMSIGKKLRFTVFDRDRFTCRYCGRDSSEVKLEVDHVLAVANGGGDEIENLVTSCFDCNRGKSDSLTGTVAPNESDRLWRLQELQEQKEIAMANRELISIRKESRQDFHDALCEVIGRESIGQRTLSVLFKYTEEFGVAKVLKWAEQATAVTNGSENNVGRYISGIRRKVLAEGGAV